MYKVLTFIITERGYIFLERKNLLPKMQKIRYRRRSYGCKDQPLLNKAILEEVHEIQALYTPHNSGSTTRPLIVCPGSLRVSNFTRSAPLSPESYEKT